MLDLNEQGVVMYLVIHSLFLYTRVLKGKFQSLVPLGRREEKCSQCKEMQGVIVIEAIGIVKELIPEIGGISVRKIDTG